MLLQHHWWCWCLLSGGSRDSIGRAFNNCRPNGINKHSNYRIEQTPPSPRRLHSSRITAMSILTGPASAAGSAAGPASRQCGAGVRDAGPALPRRRQRGLLRLSILSQMKRAAILSVTQSTLPAKAKHLLFSRCSFAPTFPVRAARAVPRDTNRLDPRKQKLNR